MKKVFLLVICFVIILGCSTTKQVKTDSVSGASPEWKLNNSQKDFLKGKKAKYKTLVAYFSKTGNTERIAYNMAVMLGGDIEKIYDKKNRDYCLGGAAATFNMTAEINEPDKKAEEYDLVIIGTPIWAWDMTPAVRAYIIQNKNKFKNLAFFTTAGNTAPDKIVKKMEKLADKKGLAYIGFVKEEYKDQKKLQEKINRFLLNFLQKQ